MKPILIDLPEAIETERLRLIMPRAGFGKQLYEAMTESYEDYVKWLAWPSTPPSLEDVEIECRKHHAEFILRDFIRYIITDKETGNLLGRCAFPPFQANWAIPQFGVSYFIRRSERLKGYATEAIHAMTLLGFRVLKARKLEIYCDTENIASKIIPLKLGFKLEYKQKGGWPRLNREELATLETYSMFSVNELLTTKIL